jgi:hypothetical protein
MMTIKGRLVLSTPNVRSDLIRFSTLASRRFTGILLWDLNSRRACEEGVG